MLFRKQSLGKKYTELDSKVNETKQLFDSHFSETLIGVYDEKNDEIILRLAIPDRVSLVVDEKSGKFLSGNHLLPSSNPACAFTTGKPLSQGEISKLNLTHQNSIARRYQMNNDEQKISGHMYMVKKFLNEKDMAYYWGFSMIPAKSVEDSTFVWTSRSLNCKENINDTEEMPFYIAGRVIKKMYLLLENKKPPRRQNGCIVC